MISMEEKINKRIIFMGVLSLVLTAAVLIGVFKERYAVQLTNEVKACAELLAQDGFEEEPGRIQTDVYRLTLIDPGGTVLYDNRAEAATLENHADRAEVAEALESGEGEAVRKSKTLGYDTYYYALRLDDGNILRVSKEAVSAVAVLGTALPVVGIAAFVILAISILLSVLLTRNIVGSIKNMVLALDNGEPTNIYRELEPVADMVTKQRLHLRENEKMRREFTANVSHELKTPLTSISGYAEMIENGMAKEADIQEFARKIHYESGRMITLVGDIIELSELDEAKAGENFVPLNLLSIAEDTAELLSFAAEKNGITIAAHGENVEIKGSRALIEELVYNLCDNAIRYNKHGGRVDITVSARESGAELSVVDTGIGIPGEYLTRIFERFYRVDKSRSKATGGTGLGLAIVKHIALLHDATINIQSEEGKGTQIKVLFKPE